ncbi:hypothetical protein QZH41_018215, partial [Actinostola sp. cb2023]
FYAPWCGYCRKLEPIWENVARTLHGSSITVAKLDATVYNDISKDYNVRGFPTIKFIKGDIVLTYSGDRTFEDIVEFAEKAGGPAVKELTSGEQLRTVQRDRTVFFLLVQSSTNDELSVHLKDIFYRAAEKRITEAYFYIILENQLPKAVKLKSPMITVFKDGSNFPFELVSKEVTVDNTTDWIDQEKFGAFMQIIRANVRDITMTGRAMVIAVFAEDNQKKKLNEKIGKVVKETALKHREKFHSSLQFGWVLGDEITTEIMMSSLSSPYIMVYNATDMLYYLMYYDDIKDDLNEEKMVAFLENVLSGKERASYWNAYGGDSYLQRIIRMFYSFFTTVYEIWTSQPIVATLMFGLPLLLFSFVIYMLCTVEVGDDQEFNEEDNDEEHYDDDEDEHKIQEQSLEAHEETIDKSGGKPKTE